PSHRGARGCRRWRGRSSCGQSARCSGGCARSPPRRKEHSVMLQWLASFLTAPLSQGALDAYKAKLSAANAEDKIAADLAVKEIEAEIEARRQAATIIIAEQGRWWTAVVRPAW